DVAAMRRRGVDVSEPSDGGRRTPAGQELRWRFARLGPEHPLPIFFIQHVTPLAERRRGHTGEHPNGVLATERVYIAVPDVAKAAETYARVLGMPMPRVQRGNVVKAGMAVFDLGGAGGPAGAVGAHGRPVRARVEGGLGGRHGFAGALGTLGGGGGAISGPPIF